MAIGHTQQCAEKALRAFLIFHKIPIPLPSGIVVTVLGEEKEGAWLEIRTQNGVMGYLPENAIRGLR